MTLTYKIIIAFLFTLLSYSIGKAQNVFFEWEKIAGGSHYARGEAIKTDSEGNVYASGVYTDTLNINDTVLYAVNHYAAYLAKFTSSGDLIWIKNFRGKTSDYIAIPSLAVDSNGGVAAGVFYKRQLAFDTTIYTNNADTLRSQNMCLVHYLSDGTLDWVKNTGGSNHYYFDGVSMEFDNGNNLYLSGTSIAIQYFDTTVVVHSLDSTYMTVTTPWGTTSYWEYFHPDEQYLACYNINGEKQWIKNIGGKPLDMSIDVNNNILICGTYKGNPNFDGQTLYSTGAERSFTAKYNPAGPLIWAKGAGSDNNGECKAYSICSDSSGNVYIGGSMSGQNIHFDTTFVSSFNYGPEAFIGRYTAAGIFQWVETFGTAENLQMNYQRVTSINIDNTNKLVIAGDYSDSLILGTGPASLNGYYDGFVARFDLNRNILDYGRYESLGQGRIDMNNMCLDEQNNIFITGINTKEYPSSSDPSFLFLAKIAGSDVIFLTEKNDSRNNHKIFPNPTDNMLLIDLDNLKKDYDIRLSDFNGNLLLEKTNQSGQVELDVNYFSKGIYILEIITNNEIFRSKVIFQ